MIIKIIVTYYYTFLMKSTKLILLYESEVVEGILVIKH